MYLNYYKLNAKPFSISPDPKFLWLGEKHAEALASLKYGILEDKGFLLLTGEIGTGKTLLINCLVKSINEDVIVATIPDPSLKLIDFYNILSNKFEMNRKFESKGDFLINFEKFLLRAHEDHKKVLLIIDEAQRLKSKLIDEIRVLSNIEFETKKLINIFFVGQRELKEMLLEERNRPLKQRITNNYHLTPLDEKETSDFILHRLKIAGANREIFIKEAIREIQKFSKGVPRLINILCDHSLLTGYSKSLSIIDVDVIKECVEELQISAYKFLIPPDQPIFTEIDPFNNEQELVNYLKRTKSYEKPLIIEKSTKYLQWFKPFEKLSNLKASVIVAIILLFGMLFVFFNSRFEQSSNLMKQRNEVQSTKDAAKNSKPPLMIAKSNDATQDTLFRNTSYKRIGEDYNDKKIIIYKVPTVNALKKIRIGFPSENDLRNFAKEEIRSKVFGSEKAEENKNKSLTDPYSANNVQSKNNGEVISTAKVLKNYKIEELKQNTLSANEIPQDDLRINKDLETLKSIEMHQKAAHIKNVDQNYKHLDSEQFSSFTEHKFLIHFEPNSANLDSSAFEILNKVVKIIYDIPHSEIIIEGYTDSSGGHVFNERLSQFRANIIKSYFIGKGIDSYRITTIGFGSDRPIAGNLTSEGRRKNRRVEIKIKAESDGG